MAKVREYVQQRHVYCEQNKRVKQSIGKALIGKSAQIEQIRQYVARFALLNINLVICGESGSGRHNIAHLVHEMGGKSDDRASIEAWYVTQQTSGDSLVEHLKSTMLRTLVVENVSALSESTQREWVQLLLEQERNQGKKVR